MYMKDSLTGLVNKTTGTGTNNDKFTGMSWHHTVANPMQLRNAYRSNWLCRKAVDIPANDMLRQGWTWKADAKDVKSLEMMERAFGIKKKILRAKRMANLYGGAAILIGDGASDPAQELNVETIAKGGLKYLTVLTRFEVASGVINHDVLSPYHNLPENYYLSSGSTGATIHPSRLVRFVGRDPASAGSLVEDVWGDSLLEGVLNEIMSVATGIISSGRMLDESTVNYYHMKGLMERLETEAGTNLVHKALHLMESMKSAINAVAIDGENTTVQQFTANFAGLPEIIQMLLQAVAGGADIPLTRLLGQSPGGLNSTGESDVRNYYDMLKSEQENDLRPSVEPIFNAVIRSTLGSNPHDIDFEFNPLWQMSAAEQADLDAKRAETISKLHAGGLVPENVTQEATKTMMLDSPHLTSAGDAWDDEDTNGNEAPTDAEVESATSVGDGTPMPLYVRRDVLNHAEITKWAKDQGFDTTLGADMHVTIAFSRAPFDWHAAGRSWEDDIKIERGGPRTVEVFGNKAIVLEISHDSLKWRHKQIKRAGAEWEWPDYRPHITITYEKGKVDLEKVTPYQGKILLGPEIFERVKEDWAGGITEDNYVSVLDGVNSREI